MTQKIKTIFMKVCMLLLGLAFILPAAVQAATTSVSPCESDPQHYAQPLNANGDAIEGGCAKIKTAVDCPSGTPGITVNGKIDKTKCQPLGNDCPDFANKTGVCSTNPIVGDLNTIVNVLAALVGVVVVGSIILGGIQFSAAGDKAEAVSAAKKRIINGLIALAAFLFIYTFLQWLIPGGIFQ